jgi:hypothetical protein
LVQLRRKLDQIGATMAYDEETGQWIDELTMSARAALQLVLPTEVLPFEATSLEIELDIKAPQREVRLMSTTANGPVELIRLQSPSVSRQITITDPDVLRQARGGVLDLVLEVSERTDIQDPAQTTSVVAWHVDALHASFRGQVTSP